MTTARNPEGQASGYSDVKMEEFAPDLLYEACLFGVHRMAVEAST